MGVCGTDWGAGGTKTRRRSGSVRTLEENQSKLEVVIGLGVEEFRGLGVEVSGFCRPRVGGLRVLRFTVGFWGSSRVSDFAGNTFERRLVLP